MSRFDKYLEMVGMAIDKCNKCGEGMSAKEHAKNNGLCPKCKKEKEKKEKEGKK